MYPLHTNPVPSTSTYIPRPTSTFKPITPASQQPVKAQHKQNHTEEFSPQSSLPCGQPTPVSSNNTTNTPSQNTPPQQMLHPATSMQTYHASPNNHVTQNKQSSPFNTGINPSAQPFIPAAGTQFVSNSPP